MNSEMSNRIYNVLFLCTGNSVNCIMAEAILNHFGKGRFQAFSAYINPVEQVNPLALEQIRRANLSSEGLCSKNWNVFTLPDAPQLDIVIRVCGQVEKEKCSNFPGKPVFANWVIERTHDLEGSEETQRRAISIAFAQLNWRISIFVNIPFTKLSEMALKNELDNIALLHERRSSSRL